MLETLPSKDNLVCLRILFASLHQPTSVETDSVSKSSGTVLLLKATWVAKPVKKKVSTERLTTSDHFPLNATKKNLRI